MKIALATQNPVKINGVKEGFRQFLGTRDIEVYSYSMPSKTKRKFMLGEKFSSAETRLKSLKKMVDNDVDYYVAIEGGLLCEAGKWFYIQTAIVQKNTSRCRYSIGLSSGLQLPASLVLDIVNSNLDSESKEDEFLKLNKSKFSSAKFVENAVFMALMNSNW